MAGDEESARAIAQAYSQELNTRANSQYQRTPDQSQGNPLVTAAETAAALGSRALLTVPAGLAGAGMALFAGPEAGGQTVRDVLSMGYDPKTVQAQAVQAGLAAPFEKGGELALKYGGPEAKLAFDVGSQLAPVGKVFGKGAARTVLNARNESALARSAAGAPLPEQINAAGRDFINNLGGYSSKTQYDAALKSQQKSQIAALKQQEAPLYGQVKSQIGKSLTVPNETYQYLQNRLAEVGGNRDALSAGERKIMSTLESNPNFVSVGGQPQAAVTYGVIDSLRKQFGKKYTNDPEFATADTAQRDAIYSALSKDQMDAATNAGVNDTLMAAHDLTRQRKAIETSHYALFDKDAVGSVVPKIETAARGLQNGDLSKYEDFVSNTPNRRQGAIQVLQMMMRPDESGVSPKFIDVVNSMDPYARKQFIKDLPPDALSRAQTIGEAAAMPLPKSDSLLNESYQNVKSRTFPIIAAEALGTMAGAPGFVTTAIGGAALSKAVRTRKNARIATAKAKQAAK